MNIKTLGTVTLWGAIGVGLALAISTTAKAVLTAVTKAKA